MSMVVLKKAEADPGWGRNPTRCAAQAQPLAHPVGRARGLAVASGGAYGRYWYMVGRYIESTNNAYLRADQVAMAPRVSGQVAEIYVKDNEDVAAGQPLVRIDPRRYEMMVRQSRATVDAREADVAKGRGRSARTGRRDRPGAGRRETARPIPVSPTRSSSARPLWRLGGSPPSKRTSRRRAR